MLINYKFSLGASDHGLMGISTGLTSWTDRRFLSGCGGAHGASGAGSADRCSGGRTVSAGLTGHF